MDKPVPVLLAENEALRKRVAELEARVRGAPPVPAAPGPDLMKLIQRKDQTLGEYTAALEAKNKTLEHTVEELHAKELEAQNNLRTIQLYKTIVENEPSCIIGIDPDLNILLFNQGAVNMFGDRIQSAIFSPIHSLELEKLLPDFYALLGEVLEHRQSREIRLRTEEGKHYLILYPLMDGDTLRGAIIRISHQLKNNLQS